MQTDGDVKRGVEMELFQKSVDVAITRSSSPFGGGTERAYLLHLPYIRSNIYTDTGGGLGKDEERGRA